jgi:hypothetical protein
MEQNPINQRVKFLAERLADNPRAFSMSIGESTTNTHKYVNGNTKPNPEFLEKIVSRFRNVDAHWLLTGEGEPFKEGEAPNQNQTNISGKKNAVNVASGNGTATTNNITLADCEKERDSYKAQLEKAQREVELLTGQVETQKSLIESKQQLLDFLRGGLNRPN